MRKRVVLNILSAQPGALDRVGYTSIGADCPNATFASPRIRVPWRRTLGDWTDRNGTLHGDVDYGSAVCPPAGGDLSIECRELVQSLLTDNTGIYLVRKSGGAVTFASLEHATGPAPRLSVTTDQGTYDCACLDDTYLSTSAAGLGTSATLKAPALLRFDLSAVRGVVQSATLLLRVTNVAGAVGGTFAVFRLDLPTFISDPAREIGGVRQGIAAGLAQDRDLANHPSVLFYEEFTSYANDAPRYDLLPSGRDSFLTKAENESYITWPDGIKAIRVQHAPSNQVSGGILAIHKLLQPDLGRPYQTAFRGGPQELYGRYLLRIDPNVAQYQKLGVKLPGLSGMYANLELDREGTDDNPRTRSFTAASAWQARMEHTVGAATNPGRFRLFAYMYDTDTVAGNGSGRPVWTQTCLRAGQRYCIEQFIKLNTQAQDGAWNRDGVLRVWVDGVLVLENLTMRFRTHPDVGFYEWFGNIYHGGQGAPSGPIAYELSGIAVGSEYIGPPRA